MSESAPDQDRPLLLREVRESDLPAFFEHGRDPEAVRMAAFTADDPSDREAFMAHWARLFANEGLLKRTIEFEGRPAGHLCRFDRDGEAEITYWIAREHWGKGLATRAVAEFLRADPARPLFGRAAADNVGSIRVLEKNGFEIVRHERGFANARGEEIDEVVLKLG